MPESEEQRQERAERIAFEAGKREAEVDARLDSYEKRLGSVVSSIEHQSLVGDALRRSVANLDDKLDGVIQTLRTNAAVDKERVSQIKDANEKQISNRQFWLGVAAIMATIVAACITVLASAHGV